MTSIGIYLSVLVGGVVKWREVAAGSGGRSGGASTAIASTAMSIAISATITDPANKVGIENWSRRGNHPSAASHERSICRRKRVLVSLRCEVRRWGFSGARMSLRKTAPSYWLGQAN